MNADGSLYSCFNVPETGIATSIFLDGDMLYAEFSKPYAFDPVFTALDDLASTACGQEASWDGLSTLSMPIGDGPAEEQARTLWITLVTAKKHLPGLKNLASRVESPKEPR